MTTTSPASQWPGPAPHGEGGPPGQPTRPGLPHDQRSRSDSPRTGPPHDQRTTPGSPRTGPAPYRPAGLSPLPVGSFASAVTRMLLAGDGSTTLLLEALTGGPIGVRLQGLDIRPAAGLPADVRALLRLTDDCAVAVRHSLLHDHHGTPVSHNEVIASLSAPILRQIATDPVRPLGPNLIAHDIEHGRHLRSTGLARWSAEERAAVSKAYLIRAADTPLMLVWEIFNPAVVPPSRHGGP
ncbi:hypothetical protein FXF51_59835 [Nonomuraea sp. PA05]|uniref:chorismate--pyruvate lyase family protein n=1 Tax=Nonomuraea sp. PA05 TaxID=2604466 RepID=UPI0011D529C8|nr:chorismate pyruvate-lyase family protein [Nonomuraea sp. PA05]TYB45860.1 hypothetical protein FXF51_59835 [Nonomuraea sp. PA05]